MPDDDPPIDITLQSLLRDSLLEGAKRYLQELNVKQAIVSEHVVDDCWLDVTVQIRRGTPPNSR